MAVFFLGIATVQASILWDANAEFNTTGTQTSSDRWQYAYVGNEVNGPYNLETWVSGDSAWHGDDGGNKTDTIYSSSTAFYICPGPSNTVGAVGWLSPITGTADIAYTLIDDTVRSGGEADGASYNVWKEGVGTALESGVLGEGATHSGSVTGISVSVGDKLWLMVGPHGYNSGDDIRVTGFTITGFPAPEPSTFVLLGCGIISLLAYAWRKRK